MGVAIEQNTTEVVDLATFRDAVDTSCSECRQASGASWCSARAMTWLRLGVPKKTPVRVRKATIGLVDGVIGAHECLAATELDEAPRFAAEEQSSTANRHATAMASLLVGRGPCAVGVAEGARLVSRPAADSAFVNGKLEAREAAARIADGIRSCVNAGVDVVALSMSFSPFAGRAFGEVTNAIQWALARDVRTVISTENAPSLASHPISYESGAVPVIAATVGADAVTSPPALDVHYWRQGLSAPGDQVPCAWRRSGFRLLGGTSVATALTAGAYAWLLQRAPGVPRARVWSALFEGSLVYRSRNSLLPGSIDLALSLKSLCSSNGGTT